MSQVKKHVLILSFPAYGHMIPLLELGRKISKYHRVSFVVSSLKVKQLQERELFVQASEHDLQLIGIDDGYLAEFDKVSNPADMVDNLLKLVIPAATKFIESIFDRTADNSSLYPVHAVIADAFLATSMLACHKNAVQFYLFNTANAGLTLGFLMVSKDDPTTDKQEDVDPFMRPPRPNAPLRLVLEAFKKLMLGVQETLPLAHGIIVNSFREVEEDALAVLQKFPAMNSITVSCVGPLIGEEKGQKGENLLVEGQVRKWLDNQDEGSVSYVSFGSVAVPAPEQIKEVGEALLLLNKPFILSLRTDCLVSLPNEIHDQIPKQMETPKNRFLVLPWSPQKVILTHPATRVFLSHCGWNSTLESFFGGVPIVGWPLFADQLLNAEWIENHGLGRMVRGTGVKPERIVLADEIREIITDVAEWNGDLTSGYVATAQIWKQKIHTALGRDGSSQREFEELVKFDKEKGECS